MVAAIPEVVETAESAGAAGARAAGRHAKPVSRVQAGRERRAAEATAAREQARAGRAEQTRLRQQETVQRRRQERLKGGARRAGRGASRARLPGSHSYQPIILAEFIAAVVIVATGPVVKGGTPEAQTKGSPSPYSVNTIKQLLAIGGVYFVLALLAASQRAGRLAAWFGGLVLIGLGLTELANGDLSAIFHAFGPGNQGSVAGTGQLAQLPPGFLPAASSGPPPTPTGQPTTTQQFVSFTQPGVATTTEQTPGVTLAGS